MKIGGKTKRSDNMVLQLIELVCCFLDLFVTVGATAEGINMLTRDKVSLDTNEPKTPQQRQANQLRQCKLSRCNSLAFRTTDYCWKHQDHASSKSEPEPEENWWEDGN